MAIDMGNHFDNVACYVIKDIKFKDTKNRKEHQNNFIRKYI